MSCHNDSLLKFLTDIQLSPSGSTLIIASIVTGFIGSFMHCTMMCGPIAVMQSSLRLINIKKLNNTSRLKASLCFPYYIGKTITYCLLTIILYIFKLAISNFVYQFIIKIILFITALAFIFIAFNINLLSKTPLSNYMVNKIKKFYLYPFGIRGLISGMFLGLMPCGFLYAVIVSIIGIASTLWQALFSVFCFGIFTIPGLFIIAYFGTHLINKQSKYFNYIFKILMLTNGALIILYLTYFKTFHTS